MKLFLSLSLLIASTESIALAQSSKGIVEPSIEKVSPRRKARERKPGTSPQDLSAAFRFAAEKTLPSVVTVYARQVDEKQDKLELGLEDVLGEDIEDWDNIGSGVILFDEGLIVTNHHVVEKCNRVKVRLPNGREFQGTDIRSDSDSDLAILSIPSTKKFSTIELGDSNALGVGDWVLAVGSPFAIEQTVSAGIISGKGRGIPGLVQGQMLQTDAAINPGNSGGALVNLDGKLVGINTAIASTSGQFQGVGFAIPVNRVMWIVSELKTHGKVRRARMGVETVPVPLEIAEKYDLPIPSGALVFRVRDDLPAAKAGVKKDDIIVKFSDQAVKSALDLNAIVEQLPIDQPLSLSVLRDGQIVELSIILQAKPQ